VATAETPSSAAALAPAEVEGLLAAIPVPPATAALRRSGTPGANEARPHDFRNPCLLSDGELRRLRSLHDDFARFVSSRLSLALRLELTLSVASLATTTYSTFTGALSNPGHLTLFKVEPLTGIGILDIEVGLALGIADRLLGGRGTAGKPRPFLTEIETALLEDVTTAFLEEWAAQWKLDTPLRPAVIGHENSGRFLQTSPKDASIVTLVLDCSFGECTGKIQLGIPYYTLEPLMKKLQSRRTKETALAPAPKRTEWHPAYDRITMPVRGEWQAFELTVRELTSLRVGDVIEMSNDICANTRVLFNGVPKFIGTVGLDSDRVAIQLTRKLPSEEMYHG
jgi:flagellar motor switch protein FliM